MFDMMKMMGKVKEMQEKMQIAQGELKEITVASESGGGMVKVTANAQKEIIGMEIDEAIINHDDKDMMRDLIIAAVNKAIAEAEEKAKDHLKKSTEGMIPNIPGMDFPGLG